MDPILWRRGVLTIYWYTALVGAGILVATAYVLWRSQRDGIEPRRALDGILWVLVGGLIGARAGYVIPNWRDYSGRPSAIISHWGGGLVFQGGLIVGAAALAAYALFVGLSFPRLADLAVRGVCLGQLLGWLGAHVHGANYGLVVRSVVSLWLPDLYGVYGPRFPTQALAALMAGVLFLVLQWLSNRPYQPGTLAALYVAGNGIGHFMLEFSRADDSVLNWGVLRGTQVSELVQVAVAAAILMYLRLRRGALVSEA